MRKNPWLMLGVLIFAFVSIFVFLLGSSAISLFGGGKMHIASKNTILHLHLDGVIIDGKKFLTTLKKYRKENKVKAIVVEINSPGGVVGPSQEIYEEIKRVREEHKKPIVAVSTSLDASGAYYASVAADKIIVAPGTLIGSIGVIMEFMNLEGLYNWAKVSRYSITTGKFKDSGSEYRPMREDERQYFQTLADDVLGQFKKAVADGRKLDAEKVTSIADGRVFTGSQAVEMGLADQLGTVEDAFKVAAELAGLGENYDVYEPPKHKSNFLEMIMNDEEEEASSHFSGMIEKVFKTQLANRPLYLMPGFW